MNESEGSPTSYLRAIGLRIPVSESVAATIWAELLIIDGHVHQGVYSDNFQQQQHYAAYHAIAKALVKKNTPDDVLEDMIPEMIRAFGLQRKWFTFDMSLLKRILHGPVTEWKGKWLLMNVEPVSGPLPLLPIPTTEPVRKSESLSIQIDRLREECRLTTEQLAEKVGLDPSSVSRHITGKAKPQLPHLGAYEKAFSKLLNRKVVIQIPPRKRK